MKKISFVTIKERLKSFKKAVLGVLFKPKPKTITVYFGIPGSGKTTLAALYARKHMKRGEDVFSNVPIIGTYRYVKEDIGVNEISDCYMIIDEASIDFNNRLYKSFPKTAIEFFKLHRHYGVAIDVFSQSFDDMDITIRRLASRFVIVRKSLFPFFITTRDARAIIDINEDDNQFVSGHRWVPFSRRWYFMPLAWPLFDSYDAPKLNDKVYEKWMSKNLVDVENKS